jgi:D-3-phosphoglycerate dehydrogenase
MAARAKILVCEDITGTGIERLKGKYEVLYDPDLWKKIPELERAVEGIDALIIRNQTKITPALVSKARNLKVIGRAGAGYDNIDVPSASQAGIVVSFSPEENAVSVAEHVFALLLSLARKEDPWCRPFHQKWRMGA